MNESLLYRIRPVARRLRVLRFWQIWGSLALIAIGTVWWMTSMAATGVVEGRRAALILASVSGLIAVISALACACLYRDPRWIAKRIEAHFPTLDQRLLTALNQRDEELGFLQQRVVKEARDHSRTHQWIDAVSAKTLWLTRLGGLGATATLAALLMILSATTPRTDDLEAANLGKFTEPIVEPGDTEIERGSSLVVTARFPTAGFERGDLAIAGAAGTTRMLPMTQNLSDPVLGAFVASIDEPITYQIVTSGWSSRGYKVDVFDFPRMIRSDADLVFPEYTKLEPKHVEDTVRVSAVVGSRLSWQLTLNKPVSSAELVDQEGQRNELVFDDDDRRVGNFAMSVIQSGRYKLELTDEAGRKNKYPSELVVRAIPNQSPKLKVTPASDTEVSPLEEFPLRVEAIDDFGISQLGIAYSLNGGETVDLELRRDIGRGEKVSIEQMLALEELDAQPDQLLSYHFFALDDDSEGKPRRTESDMYFAEVRPFDQIFRQGDPPPGGQPPPSPSPQAAEAGELAELQKEIISATWRMIRDHPTAQAQRHVFGRRFVVERITG